MINSISILFYSLVVIFSITFGFILFYHFKKFNLPDDKEGKKFLLIFKWGTFFLLSVSFLFLILLIMS